MQRSRGELTLPSQITSLKNTPLAEKFAGPKKWAVTKRKEFLPLKRSPPEPHPDSGLLLQVYITGKPTVTRNRQSYVKLRAPLLVARENLASLPNGTVALTHKAFQVVLTNLKEVCPGVVVHVEKEPKPKPRPQPRRRQRRSPRTTPITPVVAPPLMPPITPVAGPSWGDKRPVWADWEEEEMAVETTRAVGECFTGALLPGFVGSTPVAASPGDGEEDEERCPVWPEWEDEEEEEEVVAETALGVGERFIGAFLPGVVVSGTAIAVTVVATVGLVWWRMGRPRQHGL